MNAANSNQTLQKESNKALPLGRETPIYSIGTMARMLGISVHSLRMYERKGLIISYKASNNQRLYSDADFERLQCIRSAITVNKISIEGIRHVLSLIPCWAIKKCSATDRTNCVAYNATGLPCWTLKHTENACASNQCRECVVYKEMAECHKVKQQLRELIPT